jgi:hypothetical protein
MKPKHVLSRTETQNVLPKRGYILLKSRNALPRMKNQERHSRGRKTENASLKGKNRKIYSRKKKYILLESRNALPKNENREIHEKVQH